MWQPRPIYGENSACNSLYLRCQGQRGPLANLTHEYECQTHAGSCIMLSINFIRLLVQDPRQDRMSPFGPDVLHRHLGRQASIKRRLEDVSKHQVKWRLAPARSGCVKPSRLNTVDRGPPVRWHSTLATRYVHGDLIDIARQYRFRPDAWPPPMASTAVPQPMSATFLPAWKSFTRQCRSSALAGIPSVVPWCPVPNAIAASINSGSVSPFWHLASAS